MPATAARLAPVAKASALYCRTSMPTSGAVCGLEAMARMARPGVE